MISWKEKGSIWWRMECSCLKIWHLNVDRLKWIKISRSLKVTVTNSLELLARKYSCSSSSSSGKSHHAAKRFNKISRATGGPRSWFPMTFLISRYHRYILYYIVVAQDWRLGVAAAAAAELPFGRRPPIKEMWKMLEKQSWNMEIGSSQPILGLTSLSL